MATPETYSIKQIDAENFQLLVPLMQDCFGINTDINYFKWKYTRNPAGNAISFVAVADTTDEVVAHYCLIPGLFTCYGQRQIMYQASDAMTHSQHRRRGLFQLLLTHCHDYLREQENEKFYAYAYVGAQSPSTPGLFNVGYRPIFEIAYFFYPRHLSWFDVSTRLAPQGKVALETDYAQLADLLLQHNAQVPLHALREVDQFTWRLANPRRPYQTLVSRSSDGQPNGYLVFYREPDKLFLFDFFANNKVAERALFRALKKRIGPGMKGIVALSQRNTFLSQALSRNLFVRNPFKIGPLSESITFILYADVTTMKAEADPSHWAIEAYENDAL